MTSVRYDRDELLEARKASGVALFNDQPFKLGTFGSNCSNGLIASNPPSAFQLTWENTVKVAQKADNIGFELVVPLARWRGFGGRINMMGENYETHTWAAGLAQATNNIMVFATTHVPTKHPLVAAKELVTIDHISNGRVGFNITMGWFGEEFEMFGHSQREHDERYQYGAEWTEILKKVWTEDGNFDYDGKYFQLKSVEAEPKPIQKPYPVLFNAGNSAAGLDYCARECDFNLIGFESPDVASDKVKAIHAGAAGHPGPLGVLGYGTVIAADTEKEVQRQYDAILEYGDWDVAALVAGGLTSDSESFPEYKVREIKALQEQFVTTYGGFPLHGTPEQITEKLLAAKRAGIDGLIMAFLDYAEGLDYWAERVEPMLKEAGLRV